MYHLGSNENLRGVADVRPGAGGGSGTVACFFREFRLLFRLDLGGMILWSP